jgi:hypothetical protein
VANEVYQIGNTINALNNGISSGTLAASGTANFTLDLTGVGSTGTGTSTTGDLGAIVNNTSTPGGTVAATNGLQVQQFNGHGTTPTYTTVAVVQFTIPSVASTNANQDYTVNGPCRIKNLQTNLDATNAITAGATYDTINNWTSNP